MRTREEIEGERSDTPLRILTLEVLLDIRDLLDHPRLGISKNFVSDQATIDLYKDMKTCDGST